MKQGILPLGGGIFLHSWINEWQALYHNIWQSPTSKSIDDVIVLEQMTQQVLDVWGAMDEALHQLRQRLKETAPLFVYESEGTILFDAHQFDEALCCLKNEEAEGEKENIRLLYIAYASLYTEKFEEARSGFLYVLQVSFDPLVTHFAYLGIGIIEMVARRAEEAILFLEKANSLTDNPDVVYNLGICYYWLEAYDSAAAYFHSYTQVCDDADAFMLLGLSLYKGGMVEEARGVWLDCAEHVDSSEALLALAKLTEWYGEHELACYSYEQLMFINGKTPELLHGFAWNQALSGDSRAVDLLFELGKTSQQAYESWCMLQAVQGG